MIYFEKIIDLVAWLSAWLFCVAGFMLSYEVVARYFFLAPTSWAAELSQLSLIYGTLLAMPWALKSRKHIQINLVINRLSKTCLLYTSPSPRDRTRSRMPSSA